jgi:hypothetical protein
MTEQMEAVLEQKQYNNKYNSVEEMIHMSENRTYGICR